MLYIEAMNFQQLASLCAIVDHDFNITKAAAATNSTQPAISRQIRFLEKNLGVQIFYRNKKRLTALTRAGEAALAVARRVRTEAENLDKIGKEFSAIDHGDFIIATTHTYARYCLPDVIRRFAGIYSNVRVILKQGDPSENANWVASGEADLFISTEPAEKFEDIVLLPFAKLERVIVVTKGHPLLNIPRLTFQDIACYPIITSRSKTLSSTKSHGIQLNVVITATDSDVIKTYVREGLGIAIMSALAYSSKEDKDLCCIDAGHLFEPHTSLIGLRARSFLRSYMYHFIEMFVPKLKRSVVEKVLASKH